MNLNWQDLETLIDMKGNLKDLNPRLIWDYEKSSILKSLFSEEKNKSQQENGIQIKVHVSEFNKIISWKFMILP